MTDDQEEQCPSEECVLVQFNEAFPDTDEEVDDDVYFCTVHEQKVRKETDDELEPDMEEYELDTSGWFHDEDGAGVVMDTLVESLAQAKDAQELFSRFHVQLDYLLDQPETLKQEEVQELREMQQQFQHYSKVMNVRSMQLNEELEEAREEFDRN